jgi:spore coat polysaccharide biosynthesis protein SpsF
MSSSRLPGKVMMKHDKYPLIKIMVDRVKRSKLIDGVIIATTTSKNDDALCEYLSHESINFYRGSEENVLKRVLHAAISNDVDVIVELTGDCPLVDPTIIDRSIQAYMSYDADYVANTTITNTYPRGSDVQVFSTSTLKEVALLTSDPDDLENVSLFIYRNPEKYKLVEFPPPSFEIPQDTRFTLDYREDLDVILSILDELGYECTLEEICNFLTSNPEIRKINSGLSVTYINDDVRNKSTND